MLTLIETPYYPYLTKTPLILGLATMTEPPSKLNSPALYICGVRDEKYLYWSAETVWFLEDVLVLQIHEAGHNVILQRPDIVQSCLTEYLDQSYRKDPLNTPIKICAVKVLPHTIPNNASSTARRCRKEREFWLRLSKPTGAQAFEMFAYCLDCMKRQFLPA